MGVEYVLADPYSNSRAGGGCSLELSMAVNVPPTHPPPVTNALNFQDLGGAGKKFCGRQSQGLSLSSLCFHIGLQRF